MRLVYQPLYRLNDGTLAGAEALLRWTHPLLGTVPDEFIPLAEDTGHINQIGLWVLEQSMAQMARWQHEFDTWHGFSSTWPRCSSPTTCRCRWPAFCTGMGCRPRG